jgi:septal ring factor EnvC (AmiA/AmiB activator)
MVKSIFLIFFAFLLVVPAPAQSQKVDTKKAELEELRNQINALEREIKQASANEKKTTEFIEKYNKQTALLNRLIANLRSQEDQKQSEIEDIQIKVENLKSEIRVLKKNYALYVTAVYKRMYNNKLSYLLNSQSMTQALLRYRYLKTFSERGKRDIDRINHAQTALLESQEQLEAEKVQKTQIIAQKTHEETVLTQKLTEKQKLLKKIKVDKSSLEKNLAVKKQAEQKIRQLINRLIEQAAKAKRQKAPEPVATKKANKDNDKVVSRPVAGSAPVIPGNFPSLRGRILWPVSNGSILHRFGETENAKLKTVTINYGIDIKTVGDAAVRAVSEGVVSVINWIPGYGTVIIVTHSHEYRTVYGHVTGVSVSEGQKVKAGTILGKISETFEGNVLHFEIWNERQSQNPESWLSKR